MAQLIWSPRAIKDLHEACDYIARNSDRYARIFAQQVVSLIESIPQLPFLGSIVPEYDRPDIRERLFHNYRIIYRLRDDIIEVVTIHHGARLLPPKLPG
jgi:plasmid stabilization system protein ParE